MAPGSRHLRPLGRALLLGAALALAACKGSPLLPVAPSVAPAELFAIAIQSDLSAVAQGQSLQLQLAGENDRGAAVQVPKATWKSSAPAVATVDDAGRVTAVAKGEATITATIATPRREADFKLTVLAPGETPPPPQGASPTPPAFTPTPTPTPTWAPATPAPSTPTGVGLWIYPVNPRVTVGERLRMAATVGQASAQQAASVLWRSSDSTIARVDDAGVVTGVAAGTVTLSATSLSYPGLVQAATLTVVPATGAGPVTGIRITPSKVSMGLGETTWLQVDVPTASGGNDAAIRFVSGDTRVVTVAENGMLTAVGPGKTTVTAYAQNYDDGTQLKASVPVEVKNASGSSFWDRLSDFF